MGFEVFATSRDVVIAVDGTGRLVYGNPVARSMACDALVQRVIAGDIADSFEWLADGRWFNVETTTLPDGVVLCIARDISLLKRTELRLRQSEQLLVDTQGVAHLGTWEWDISKPTATWSDELYRIYGLTREIYTPSYEQYLTMVHPDDRQRVIDATNRVFHEHVPYSHDERIFRPDGSMRYLHTWAYPILDEAKKLTHLIGVCQDITDRALAEDALHVANTDLEQRVADRTAQLESALGDLEAFNSMVSHDLRAPLAVMQMAVDLMARVPEKSDPKHLDRIRKAIGNMSSLMDDLLAFARLGQASIQTQEIDVSAMAAEVIADLRLATPEREAQISIEPGLRCVADPSLFRVVLVNLAQNAWKYSARQAVTRIEIGRHEAAAGSAFFVRDNGVGFDMAESAKLFAPFERLGGSSGFSGSGVGLATVQRILQRHGGTITAESTPGTGSTFVVTLPAR